jgi:hypothetical protein
MSRPVLSAPRGGRALAGLLAAFAVAGCGVRIDGPPPPLPSPDRDESVRQHAAVLAEQIADAAGRLGAAEPAEDDVDQVAAHARAHLDALGGVWRPPTWATTSPGAATPPGSVASSASTPDAAPSRDEVADLVSAAAEASCDGALDVEAAELATLLASVCLAQRRAAGVLGAELDALGEPDDEPAGAGLVADGFVGSADVASLARALDAAGFAHEVAAARTSGLRRAELARRAQAHRETAQLLLTAARTVGTPDDPRRAAYALSDRVPDPGEVETEVLAAWTAVLGTADAAGRGAVLVEMDTAARAAAEWGAPPDPFPGLG